MSDAHVPAAPDPWARLRALTPARIALGRVGTSLPTAAQLDFQLAHAGARDAVHLPFEPATLLPDLHAHGLGSVVLHSAAPDRHDYLQRPDLGRRLGEDSARDLRASAARHATVCDVAIVVADGLSALAVHRHAAAMAGHVATIARAEGWSLGPVALVHQGRVAIGDEIGQVLGARMVVVLIGERPGLSSPDSLGVYFTWAPRVGLNDASRNCISNVRPDGLPFDAAAHKLRYLMREANCRQLSGVQLKDQAERPVLEEGTRRGPGNFLAPR